MKSKPKIAFVLPELNMGGAQRVVTTLANSLISEYEIVIITFTNTRPFYELNNDVTLINCRETIEPSPSILKALKNNYILLKRINSIVESNDIDLMIGFLTSANILTTIVAKFRGIPVIISERNNPFLEKPSRVWQKIRSITYPFADFVVVQTNTIKGYYEDKIKKDRLKILPNPISTELARKKNKDIIKENLILNAGRLSDQKAQDILIEAFAQTKNSNWKLIIAGEGSNRAKYEELIHKLSLEDKVFLIGKQRNIHRLYNKSKIFAFSSVFEGFPNALIEAMYFGLACVSTDCPTGPSELIKNGENGYLVPVNDIGALAEKLDILMNDDSKCKVFGELANKTVEKFETKNVVIQWKAMIDNVLD